jgi:hypothetical protein
MRLGRRHPWAKWSANITTLYVGFGWARNGLRGPAGSGFLKLAAQKLRCGKNFADKDDQVRKLVFRL